MISIMQKEAFTIFKQINEYSDDEALRVFLTLVSLKGIENALNEITNMDKKYYLKQHPYDIYYSKHDKRYRTYLPLSDGRRKAVTSVSKENLATKIKLVAKN